MTNIAKIFMFSFGILLSSSVYANHMPSHVVPAKKAVEVTKPVKVYTGTWKPPLEIQNKVK